MSHADESVPTGMPDDDAPEPPPLGDPDPEPDEAADNGPEAQPGIPTEGEPPTAG
jgi:hypothetical protein